VAEHLALMKHSLDEKEIYADPSSRTQDRKAGYALLRSRGAVFALPGMQGLTGF